MADLGGIGQAFYDALTAAIVRHPGPSRALALEAARAYERLQDLDDVISGKGVLDLLRFRLRDEEGLVAEVKFDAVLSEARQQQANFAALMKALSPNLDESAGTVKVHDVLDEIAERRRSRGAGPAEGAVRAGRAD